MSTNDILRAIALTLVLITLISCGQGSRRVPTISAIGTQQAVEPAAVEQQVTWPAGLPEDSVQPWEELDANGNVVPPRSASNLNFDSIFASGIERYLTAGDVTNFGEASSFASGAAGGEAVSYAIYRLPMGTDQPGTITADVNAHNGSSYYIGVGDYSANTWHWHGPFAATHVRFNVPDAEYTSGIGNLMLAVVAYDGATFDVVAIGANVRDAADTEAPPIPDAPSLTPVAGGVFAEWLPVVADDLAGYRTYADGVEVLDYLEGGTSIVIPCAEEVEVTLSAVDISGNESEMSDPATETPLAGEMPVVELTATAASGVRNDVIELAATGAETYDWDIDGDGVWDFTDDATGMSEADTNDLGVIRPAVRAHTSEGGFTLNAISLFITGNFRPVVMVTADVTYGTAPLDVEFTIVAEDDDGTIDEYAWDFDGDGTFDDSSATDPSPLAHSYPDAGMYNAKFRATDDEGAWAVDTVGIQVLPAGNSPPTADIQADVTSGDAPLTVNLDAASSSDSDGIIVEYAWDVDGDGAYDKFTDDPTYTYTYNAASDYDATVRVTDDDGAQDTDTIVIAVNAPPIADLRATPSEGEKGLTVFYDASSSSDPDGSITDYEWDLDDDEIFNEVGDEEDARGAPSVLQVYPNAGYYTVTVRVTDDGGAWDEDDASVTVHGWMRVFADQSGTVGEYTSLAIVNGNPAISYWDMGNHDLKYVRATDVSGSSWEIPVTADSAAVVGSFTSLAVVSGYPAISYYADGSADDLKYVRATDPEGSSWGTVVTIDNTGEVGLYTSLEVVNGRPAISYYDYTNGDLKYVRASDATGSSWDSPFTVDAGGNVGKYTSLALVNGRPAISYYDVTNTNLKYVRASDDTGSAWGAPVSVDSSGNAGKWTSLAVVNDYPAISYQAIDSDYDLRYVRATHANGTSWGTPVTVDSDSLGGLGLGDYSSLAVVDGLPAISYYQQDGGYLKFAQAVDACGDSWTTPIRVDSMGTVGEFTSLIDLTGYPAIAYYRQTNQDLKFARLY